jgi:hypothetical protein
MGQLLIDGIDIEQFGVFVTEGGYKGLLSFPSLKEPKKKDWAERDGIEVDLSAPKLDTKNFSISFVVKTGGNLNGFTALIFNVGFHVFNFIDLGVTRNLRLVSSTDFKGSFDSMQLFSMEFADDFPLSNYNYVAPASTKISQRGYKLDLKDFSEYGVAILEGTDAEILKPCSIKPNLTVNVKYLSGVICDVGRVVLQHKEVKLNCLMLASNNLEFWRNYNSLLYDLTRVGLRYVTSNGIRYPCYYKSSSVSQYDGLGKIWCQFDLVLVFTKQGVSI